MLYLHTVLHVISASAAIAALTAIASTVSMFYDITNFQDEIRMDLQQFKEMADDAWSQMMTNKGERSVYENLITRAKRQAGGDQCQCAPIATNCPPGPPGPPGLNGEDGEPGTPGQDGN
ncbi:nematode cuticle collagen domain protein, partial [Ostertagia ostertagi]